MAKAKEQMIFIRNRWEIAHIEKNSHNNLEQWVRRDTSFICFVGKEEAILNMPAKPEKKK